MDTSCGSAGPAAEFDAYTADYEAAMANPLSRCLGGDPTISLEFKAHWLLRQIRRCAHCTALGSRMGLLDYGCGRGTMLHRLRRQGFPGSLVGCDVSPQMLGQATHRSTTSGAATLALMPDARAPFDDRQFDFVVASSVLHHVAVAQRQATYTDMARLLKRGGHLCIFEHNPLNPLTRWVVRRAPMDKNAVLLHPKEVCDGLRRAGITRLRVDYLMFFPPRWRFCWSWESLLRRLSIGAQYVVSGCR